VRWAKSFAGLSKIEERRSPGDAPSGELVRESAAAAPENGTHAGRIRVVVVDEVGLSRASLARFLAAEPDLEVAGECASAGDALALLKRTPADVVLSDFGPSVGEGNGLLLAARQAGLRTRFLILAAALDIQKAALALKLGAVGIFLKSDEPERLIEAVRSVAAGRAWIGQEALQSMADHLIGRLVGSERHRQIRALENRERKVLDGIMEGLSNRKIGEGLGLSESSVKNVVQRLFAKTGVNTRGQLVRVALDGSLTEKAGAP
jgi:DNA-binding NarL/FixJ family response regulator